MQREPSRADNRSYHWYALQVMAGSEATAALFLRQRGVAVIRPTHVVHGRRRALFPGYILIGHWQSAPMRWDLVTGAPRVLSVVGIDGAPIRLAQADIWRVMMAASQARFDVPDAAAIASLSAGQKVRVRGSMIDQVMEVRAVRAGVAELFAKFFGGERVVQAPVARLVAAQ